VQEQHPVGAAFSHEIVQRAVQLKLHRFLPNQRFTLLVSRLEEWQIEEAEARERAPRALDRHSAEVIEHVAHVARSVARVTHGIGGEQGKVLAERQQASLLLERPLHLLGDASQVLQNSIGAHHHQRSSPAPIAQSGPNFPAPAYRFRFSGAPLGRRERTKARTTPIAR
jgi:hypothetical protein